ncbi:MAG: HAD-IB family phosphatase [Gemmatimonadaceae bacterium]
MTIPRFRAVVIDVDSTLCGIEGIDWLAARRGPHVAREIALLTERAMNGEIPLDSIYGGRLGLVRPAAAEVAELGRAYVEALAPGAREAIFRMRGEGVALALVSGGIRQAIRPLARELGFSEGSLHAVSVSFDDEGVYCGYDTQSPLTNQRGKKALVAALGLPRPVLAVGDGATDAAMREATDAFAAFTGFVRRERVVHSADYVVSSFRQLTDLVLP